MRLEASVGATEASNGKCLRASVDFTSARNERQPNCTGVVDQSAFTATKLATEDRGLSLFCDSSACDAASETGTTV